MGCGANQSRWWDSNPRPDDYKSSALPAAPHRPTADHGSAGPGQVLASSTRRWQAGVTMALTDSDLEVLAFEGSWWIRGGTKRAGIRRLGLSPTAYYRRLAALVDDTAAAAVAPLVVHRLRRRRLERRRVLVDGAVAPTGRGR
jgi:Protein of unknown function (DUF3263)